VAAVLSSDLLQGRRILVTGGGKGLGRSMGQRFLDLGADLIICGRDIGALDATATAFRAARPGANVTTHGCDIRSGDAVDAMMSEIWSEAPLDILVNSAAATFLAQTHLLSHRAADAILAPTLHGALYCTLAAGKRWIEGKHPGTVLSILSTSAITGRAFTVPSAMAKTALLAMTKSLAVEWGPRGVRFVAIAPGHFPTAGSLGQLSGGSGTSLASGNPLGRSGEHEELTNLAAFLVSDAAGYINGETITIDGGQHLRSSGIEELLSWTDEDWRAFREKR
jgi:NAD(P)-dependent dehydrogenase (short-subunit alcohol dehydrogenase family)